METHVGLETLMLYEEDQEQLNKMLTGIPFEQITDVEILKQHENDLLGGKMFKITRCDGKQCLVYILHGLFLCMEVC
uniref:Acetyltransferase n=1 Tax=Caenorhabditis tropicalis TaxID=1561998 RepID=A0A1I7UU08_9PELO